MDAAYASRPIEPARPPPAHRPPEARKADPRGPSDTRHPNPTLQYRHCDGDRRLNCRRSRRSLNQGDGDMEAAARRPLRRPEPTFGELFTLKLVTILRDGYTGSDFRADAIAGLTVAIVALSLSMAIAIGSGLSPDKGL